MKIFCSIDCNTYFYIMKFSIDLDKDFRKHLERCAKDKKIKQLGRFIKAVLKKETGYKEKELI